MSVTSIEWTQRVWNPFAGCSILSPGCTNCYAMKMARRIEACNAGLRQGHGGSPHYAGTTKIVNGRAVWTGKIGIASDELLTAPLRRKKPTTYFINSMSDLFHEGVPDEAIDKVFAVMALTPQHTYQVLTKRGARMREYVNDCGKQIGRQTEIRNAIDKLTPHPPDKFGRHIETTRAWNRVSGAGAQWCPLPNLWLGVSTERQKEADERIPVLLATPAAIRFISAEPLLGPIDLTALTLPSVTSKFDALCHGATYSMVDGRRFYHIGEQPTLDQVIVGGENASARCIRTGRDHCATSAPPPARYFSSSSGEAGTRS